MSKRLLFTLILAILALSGCGTTPQQSLESDPPELALVRTIAGELLSVPPAQLQTDVPIGRMKPPMNELDLVELVMELEDRLKVTISDGDLVAVAGTDNPTELLNHLTLHAIANVAGQSKDKLP
jgi:hypothetical protein